MKVDAVDIPASLAATVRTLPQAVGLSVSPRLASLNVTAHAAHKAAATPSVYHRQGKVIARWWFGLKAAGFDLRLGKQGWRGAAWGEVKRSNLEGKTSPAGRKQVGNV